MPGVPGNERLPAREKAKESSLHPLLNPRPLSLDQSPANLNAYFIIIVPSVARVVDIGNVR